jgi:xanthine/uracil permease
MTMTDTSIGTPEQLRDPNYMPALHRAVPLGIQHVLAMFVSNVTPAIIIAGAAGFGFGSDAGAQGFPDMTYLIQMSMLFAGIATLFQTIGMGPVGARLPIVQGTSFAFIPIMIPLVAGKGVEALPALFGGVLIGGLFHMVIGTFIGKIRFALPPLVTGLVVTMIGLALVKVGIQYAAGGVPAIDQPEYGSLLNWSAALVVIFVTLALKFYVGYVGGVCRRDRYRCRLFLCDGDGHGHAGWDRNKLGPRGCSVFPDALQIRVRDELCCDHRLLPDGVCFSS